MCCVTSFGICKTLYLTLAKLMFALIRGIFEPIQFKINYLHLYYENLHLITCAFVNINKIMGSILININVYIGKLIHTFFYLFTAVFTLVAVSRFADMKEMKINSDYSLSFSFVFSILGMILALVACGLVVIHIRKSSQPATSSDFT